MQFRPAARCVSLIASGSADKAIQLWDAASRQQTGEPSLRVCIRRSGKCCGGHAPPTRQRYHRLWALVIEAITRCDQATVYDNSGIKGPRIVVQMSEGFIVGFPTWPAWTPTALQHVGPLELAPASSTRP